MSSPVVIAPVRGIASLRCEGASLACDADGFVSSAREGEGLFVGETRFLSRWHWRCERGHLQPLGGAPIGHDRWMSYFVASEGEAVPSSTTGTVELILRRTLNAGGMTEEATFTHYGLKTARLSFSLELDADFREATSARGPLSGRRGLRRSRWHSRGAGVWEAIIHWRPTGSVLHLWNADRPQRELATQIRFEAYGCVIRPRRGGVRVEALLAPHAQARVVATVRALNEEATTPRRRSGRTTRTVNAARVDAPGTPALAATIVQAFEVARAEARDRSVLPATTREGLVAAIQGATLGAESLIEALEAAATGGARAGDRSDGCDAMYAIALAELWSWTGDRAQVAPFADVALARLRKMDVAEDRDGDGFYEQVCPGAVGVDGRPAEAPIATGGAQGYAFLGKVRLAQVMLSLGRADEARRLANQANDLQRRFVHVFWMPDEAYLALGLDRRKRPIRSIASDAGHCLATGILPVAWRRPVANRLLAPDLYSGWGIRSLSADHPAYDPYLPGRGAIGVAEQATIALGMGLADLHEHAACLARGAFEAATLFARNRLPDAISGHPRDDAHPFPASAPGPIAPAPGASSPIVALVRALLGLAPNARARRLTVDPHLPAWLPELTLRELQVGNTHADLPLRRTEGGRTLFDLLDVQGDLDVVRRPATPSSRASADDQPRAV